MPDFSTILKEIWEILLIFLHSIYASLMRVIWPGPGKSLLGEIALVTGAGHGIGRELSLQLGKKKRSARCTSIFSLHAVFQCWTVGAIFTFGRSRMFGPDKLRPLAVGRSRSRMKVFHKQSNIESNIMDLILDLKTNVHYLIHNLN